MVVSKAPPLSPPERGFAGGEIPRDGTRGFNRAAKISSAPDHLSATAPKKAVNKRAAALDLSENGHRLTPMRDHQGHRPGPFMADRGRIAALRIGRRQNLPDLFPLPPRPLGVSFAGGFALKGQTVLATLMIQCTSVRGSRS